MTRTKVVFLLDVDNTLLDNDRVIDDLMRHLEREVGHERQQHYWTIYALLASKHRELLGKTMKPGKGKEGTSEGEKSWNG